jgi:hypothetical protein
MLISRSRSQDSFILFVVYLVLIEEEAHYLKGLICYEKEEPVQKVHPKRISTFDNRHVCHGDSRHTAHGTDRCRHANPIPGQNRFTGNADLFWHKPDA